MKLNALSKEILGKPSRWQKLVKGSARPAKNEFGQVLMPKQVGRKGRYVRHTRWTYGTLESAEQEMLDIKTKQQELLDKAKASVDETDNKA